MSLDVYLRVPDSTPALDSVRGKIFIREHGETKEISPEEWAERHPNIRPVMIESDEDAVGGNAVVYWGNITHNMGRMAQAVGIYQALWRPEEIGATKAQDIIEILRDGLARMVAEYDDLQQHNPQNGWGDYDVFRQFVVEYLAACEQHPDALIEVSR